MPFCACDVISTLEEQQANCGNGTWQFVKYFPKEKKKLRGLCQLFQRGQLQMFGASDQNQTFTP